MNSTNNKTRKLIIKRPKIITVTKKTKNNNVFFLFYNKAYTKSGVILYTKNNLEKYTLDRLKEICLIHRLAYSNNKDTMIQTIINKFNNKEKNLLILNVFLHNNKILQNETKNNDSILNRLKEYKSTKIIYNKNNIKLILVEIEHYNDSKFIFETKKLQKHTKFVFNNKKDNTLQINSFKQDKINTNFFYIRYKALLKII
jgi:hypothetical protein